MSQGPLDNPLKLVTYAGYTFQGFGVLAFVGGVILTFDDPAGLFLCVFGLVFFGAGYMARKLFAKPEGMKAVVLETSGTSGAGHRAQSTSYTFVDEDATDEEVEATRKEWLHDKWADRPDWVSGRMPSELSSSPNSMSMLVSAEKPW